MKELPLAAWTMVVSMILITAGCKSTGPGETLPNGNTAIPEECGLAQGDRVRSMRFNNTGPIDLAEGEAESLSVTVNLNRVATGTGVVCLELKDSELVRGQPLSVGIVVVRPGESSFTNAAALPVVCSGNEIQGRVQTLVRELFMGGDASAFERSSNERSTRVRAQELRGIQTFAGIAVGVQGSRSERIRVRCRN